MRWAFVARSHRVEHGTRALVAQTPPPPAARARGLLGRPPRPTVSLGGCDAADRRLLSTCEPSSEPTNASSTSSPPHSAHRLRWNLAAAVQSAHDVAFRSHACIGGGAAHLRAGPRRPLVVRTDLEPDRALPYRRHDGIDGECLGDLGAPSHALDAGSRQHDGVERAVAHLGDASVQVAANLDVVEVVAHRPQLGQAPERARARRPAGRRERRARRRHSTSRASAASPPARALPAAPWARPSSNARTRPRGRRTAPFRAPS